VYNSSCLLELPFNVAVVFPVIWLQTLKLLLHLIAIFFFLAFPLCHRLVFLCLLGYVFSMLVPLHMVHMELETEYHDQVGELLHIQKVSGLNVPTEILCVHSVL
jgi:hypothetical protein